MSLLADADAVYEALSRRSPQEADELAESSGIDGDRLQMAVVWLELQGQVERDLPIDEPTTSAFSAVRLTPTT
jgi:predicted Rossmann fold nucleotide-binding protein DprA/Smf involved in DNA uptake